MLNSQPLNTAIKVAEIQDGNPFYYIALSQWTNTMASNSNC